MQLEIEQSGCSWVLFPCRPVAPPWGACLHGAAWTQGPVPRPSGGSPTQPHPEHAPPRDLSLLSCQVSFWALHSAPAQGLTTNLRSVTADDAFRRCLFLKTASVVTRKKEGARWGSRHLSGAWGGNVQVPTRGPPSTGRVASWERLGALLCLGPPPGDLGQAASFP